MVSGAHRGRPHESDRSVLAARWSPGPTAAGSKRVTAVCRRPTTAVCRGQREHPYRARNAFTGDSQLSRRMRGSRDSLQRRNNVSNFSTDRKRKLMMLGGLGLGLAMLGRKRRWRRYAMSQMMGGGYAGAPWGRFGGYGHGVPGGPAQAFTLPPFIEATLKAWHDRAHGTVPPPGPTSQPGTTQV